MNAKTPTALDPKLKAIYDQVMATVVTPPTTPAPVITPIQAPKPLPTIADLAATTPPAAQQRPTLVTTETLQQMGPNVSINKGLYGTLPTTRPIAPSTKRQIGYIAQNEPSVKKSGSPLMPLIFVVSGLIFFVAYTVFWIKFFNLPVPFLPI